MDTGRILQTVKADLLQKKPLGVWVLGAVNLLLFGILSFLFALQIYLNASSRQGKIILEEVERNFSGVSLDPGQLKTAAALQMVIALVFAVSGYGLLARREWSRKYTLYFSFFMVVVAFLTALFNPGLIGQATFQVIYPGIMIIYLTGKKTERFFALTKQADDKTTGSKK